MNEDDKMKELKNHIKNKDYKTTYLFYGEESYLIKTYKDIVIKKALDGADLNMNVDYFEGKSCSVDKIIDACQTMPFFSEKRLVILQDTKLLVTGRKDDAERMANFIKDIPPSTILIFDEAEIDKRGKLYKKINELGRCVEFKPLTESELIRWVKKIFNERGKDISGQEIMYFLGTIEDSMEAILNEAEKLASYTGSRAVITKQDIDDICSKSLNSRIFEMIDAIGMKNSAKAMEIYSNLLLLKEQPIMILSLIARQFRLMYKSLVLSKEGKSADEAARALNEKSFVIKKCLEQGRNFSQGALKKAVDDCLKADIGIKTGKIGDKLAVEVLILTYCIA